MKNQPTPDNLPAADSAADKRDALVKAILADENALKSVFDTLALHASVPTYEPPKKVSPNQVETERARLAACNALAEAFKADVYDPLERAYKSAAAAYMAAQRKARSGETALTLAGLNADGKWLVKAVKAGRFTKAQFEATPDRSTRYGLSTWQAVTDLAENC